VGEVLDRVPSFFVNGTIEVNFDEPIGDDLSEQHDALMQKAETARALLIEELSIWR
jgi:hypothetical protein